MNKNNFFKLATLIGAAASLVSCGSNYPGLIGSTFIEGESHYVEGTLHEVRVTERGLPFVTNGKTDYKVIYQAGNTWALKAATFIFNHVYRATGASIEIIEDDGTHVYTSDDKIIVIGVDRISTDAGVTKTDKPIGNGGYQLVTRDNSAFILTNSGYGYVHGARQFLKATLGYEVYSQTITVYEKDGAYLPEINAVEAPDMTYRMQSNKMDPTTAYEMGFLSFNEAFYTKHGIQAQHNSFNYFPVAEYAEDFPEWYASDKRQLCYTAHGDEEKYNLLVDTFVEKLKFATGEDPEQASFSFTIEDHPTMCMCDACCEYIETYGGDSAAVVIFLNDVDDKLQAWLQEEADKAGTKKREVNLIFFAYLRTETPCVTLDRNGQYVPNSPDVVCNENVIPYIAPIYADYVNSFYAEENIGARQIIDGWKALSDRTYFWLYETNYSHYLYPFNSYANMLETYRYCVSGGADFMFNEGQHNQGAVTCFGKFKEYLNYVGQYNVNLEYEDIVDDFFTNYFREAKDAMLQLFYEIQDHCYYLEKQYPADVTGNIYTDISQARFWPKKLLDHYVDLCNQAMAAIEKYKDIDYNLYMSLYKNVLLESIFPRFAILEHHRGKFIKTEIEEMINEFANDCSYLGVTMKNENTSLKTTLDSWLAA